MASRRIPNRDISVMVSRREEFTNCKATCFASYYGPDVYGVFSYCVTWPIAVRMDDGKWYTHNEKISRTTSAHTTRVMAGIRGEVVNTDRWTLVDLWDAGSVGEYARRRLIKASRA